MITWAADAQIYKRLVAIKEAIIEETNPNDPNSLPATKAAQASRASVSITRERVCMRVGKDLRMPYLSSMMQRCSMSSSGFLAFPR